MWPARVTVEVSEAETSVLCPTARAGREGRLKRGMSVNWMYCSMPIGVSGAFSVSYSSLIAISVSSLFCFLPEAIL